MRAHTSQTSALFFFPSFDARSELLSRRGRSGVAVRFRSTLGRLVGRFASACVACSFERRPKEAASVWASARPSLACLSCMRMNVTSSCVVSALPTRERRKGWMEAEGGGSAYWCARIGSGCIVRGWSTDGAIQRQNHIIHTWYFGYN